MKLQKINDTIQKRLVEGGSDHIDYFKWSEFTDEEKEIINNEWTPDGSNVVFKTFSGIDFSFSINFDE